MHPSSRKVNLLLFIPLFACAGVGYCQAQTVPLTTKKLDAVNVKVEDVSYKGKKAVRVMASDADETIAIVKDNNFENGVIELDVAGTTLPTASTTARGFIGLAFRVRMADSVRYECFYIRPTNGHAEDQLRRNHSTQYISHPKYTWLKLRDENPGVFESYADMVPGEWTHIKIEVNGNKANLYVNSASQPCLIINDLKYGISSGSIALWVGPGTEGYFANLKIQPMK